MCFENVSSEMSSEVLAADSMLGWFHELPSREAALFIGPQATTSCLCC